MDNKFYRKDISKFDPTNASAKEIRKWLFAIIDAELEKDPEDRDYDLIEQCSDFEAELPLSDSDIELSESELAAGLERIKARIPAAECKETKILEPKKKPKKSVRIIAVLAASLAVLILSVTVAAAVQGKPVLQFISDNVKAILGMDAGDKLEDRSITLVKYGESLQYSSVEEAISSLEYRILYPSYLPEGVKIERIVVTDNGQGGMKIVFITNDINLSLDVTNSYQTNPENWNEAIIYNVGSIEFYIIEKLGTYQAIGYSDDLEYNVMYHNYDELINILDGIKEIEK